MQGGLKKLGPYNLKLIIANNCMNTPYCSCQISILSHSILHKMFQQCKNHLYVQMFSSKEDKVPLTNAHHHASTSLTASFSSDSASFCLFRNSSPS